MSATSSIIRELKAIEVLDGQGWPTLEVSVTIDDGTFRAISSSTISSGPYEGVNITDENPLRYGGRGVTVPMAVINEITKKSLVGYECTDQIYLDKRLVEAWDGSKNGFGWSSSKIGRNTISAISMAIARAGAAHRRLPLPLYLSYLGEFPISRCQIPRPAITVIGGGLVGGSLLPIESIFIIPHAKSTFKESMRIAHQVVHRVKSLLKEAYGPSCLAISDEGAYSPPTSDVNECLALVTRAIHEAGEGQCGLGMDVGAHTFYHNGLYDVSWKMQEQLSLVNPGSEHAPVLGALPPSHWRQLLSTWLKAYQIEVLIDPIALEPDHSFAYQYLAREFGDATTICMHRTTGSQPGLVAKFAGDITNGLVISPAQVSSVTEILASARSIRNSGVALIMSTAGSESEDAFIVDLAVGVSASILKIGGLERGERTSKINQLLRIEEKLSKVTFYRDEDPTQ